MHGKDQKGPTLAQFYSEYRERKAFRIFLSLDTWNEVSLDLENSNHVPEKKSVNRKYIFWLIQLLWKSDSGTSSSTGNDTIPKKLQKRRKVRRWVNTFLLVEGARALILAAWALRSSWATGSEMEFTTSNTCIVNENDQTSSLTRKRSSGTWMRGNLNRTHFATKY